MTEIINGDALRDAVARAIELAGGDLAAWQPGLERGLLRAATEHESVRPARRRRADPEWAQRKFALGLPLRRFHEADRTNLTLELAELLGRLRAVAELAARPGTPIGRAARKLLAGVPHHRGCLFLLLMAAESLLARARRAELLARRHEGLRPPAALRHEGLAGHRCASIAEIMALGRTAGNCLRKEEGQWEAFARGEVDIWALHRGAWLVGVLEVTRDGPAAGTLAAALGPRNAAIGAADAPAVAAFCRAAGIVIGQETDLLLPEFADPPLLGPRTVVVGEAVAVFVEWPGAVRVDIRGGRRGCPGGLQVVALAFDPGRSLAESTMAGEAGLRGLDGRTRKLLRKVVRAVAMEQAVPSLVQHRLLALAA